MRRLAQSTAYTVMLKLFLSSDHVSAATGKTVAIKISKGGGAFADPNAGASNATEVSNGWYKFALDTTDTATLGDLVVRGTSASCDDAEQVCQVISATTGGATNLDAAVSSRSSHSASDIWAVGTRLLTAGTNIVLAKGTGVTGFNDLSAAQVNAEADTALSDAGVTSVRQAHLDADISSRMATFSYTAPDNASITAIKTKTDNLPADPADASDVAAAITAVQNHGDTYWLTATGFSTSADITGAVSTLEGYGDTNWSTATGFSTLDAAGVRDAVGLASANLDAQIGTLATASVLTTTDGKIDGVKSVTDSLVMTAGKLWVLDESGNALPHAADVKTQADQALADAGVTTTVTSRIDVATSTRLAAADYTAPDDTAVLSAIGSLNDISAAEVNAEVDTAISDAALATAASLATTDGKVDAVKTKTDGLTFTVSGQVDANMQSINDTLLTGDGSTGDKFGPA